MKDKMNSLSQFTAYIDSLFPEPRWDRMQWKGIRTRLYRLRDENVTTCFVYVTATHDAQRGIYALHFGSTVDGKPYCLATYNGSDAAKIEALILVWFSENCELKGDREKVTTTATRYEQDAWRPKIN